MSVKFETLRQCFVHLWTPFFGSTVFVQPRWQTCETLCTFSSAIGESIFFFWAKVIRKPVFCYYVPLSSAKGPVIIYRGWRGGERRILGRLHAFQGGPRVEEIAHRQQNTKMGLEKIDDQWTAHEETGGKGGKGSYENYRVWWGIR